MFILQKFDDKKVKMTLIEGFKIIGFFSKFIIYKGMFFKYVIFHENQRHLMHKI
jgi:hypothetical protein